jgi:lysine-specific demethylase 8
MALNNIPRISAPHPEAFFRDYVLPGRPVIITDLFDGKPIRGIDTVAEARRALGDVELLIQPNSMSFLDGSEPAPPRTLRLAEYVDHVEQFPDSRDLCVEYATPDSLRDLFPRPAYCKLRDESDVVSATFVANGGNYNHLHFDDDQRGVLLYQVFGIKRFVVISPNHARKLDAFLVFDRRTAEALAATPSRDANGRVFLENFPSEAMRDAFLRYAHAAEASLQPGETIFIPALHWHYVDYVDLSMSLTYRLGRNRYNRALSALFPRPTVFVQGIGARLVDAEEAKARHDPLVEQLYAECLRAAAGSPDARALQRLIARLFEDMYGESVVGVLAARELYHQTLKAQLASQG